MADTTSTFRHDVGYTTVLELLAAIQVNSRIVVTIVPSDAEIVNVNLNTRQIELASSAYSDFLSVAHDHYAETIYFSVPRYFDGVDLMRMCCVVEYTNAKNESYVAPISVVDSTSRPGDLIFGWCLHGAATAATGNLKFAIRFFAINLETGKYIYSLRTRPVTGKVLYGAPDQDYLPESLDSEPIYQLVQKVKNLSSVYWFDLDDYQAGDELPSVIYDD